MKVTTLLASALVLATGEAYRISLYSSPSYQGTQRSYSTNGAHYPGFTVRSWIWDSNLGDGCCVAFCRGSTVSYPKNSKCPQGDFCPLTASKNVGRFCGDARNSDSSAGATKVVTGCGGAVLNC